MQVYRVITMLGREFFVAVSDRHHGDLGGLLIDHLMRDERVESISLVRRVDTDEAVLLDVNWSRSQ